MYYFHRNKGIYQEIKDPTKEIKEANALLGAGLSSIHPSLLGKSLMPWESLMRLVVLRGTPVPTLKIQVVILCHPGNISIQMLPLSEATLPCVHVTYILSTFLFLPFIVLT